jgi:hypothetical protein
MKNKVTSTAFVWSIEDLDSNIHQLADAGIISEQARANLLKLDDEDKFNWLEEIIEITADEIKEVINRSIGDSIYDYYRSTPFGKEEVGHIKYNK